METISITLYDQQYDLGIVKGKYSNNGTMYLGTISTDNKRKIQ